MRLGVLGLLLTACGGELVHRGDVFFTISGAVDPDAPLTGERTRAAIAWVWTEEDVLAGYVEAVPFVPRVNGYEIAVAGPPLRHLATAEVAAPRDRSGPAVAWGVPLLYEPADGFADVLLDVRPERMAEWTMGILEDTHALVVPDDPSSGHVVAVARDHLLVAMGTGSDVARLGDDPSWNAGGWCGFDLVVPGLTLYRRPYEDCDAWEPLGMPGERTGFQAIDMTPP